MTLKCPPRSSACWWCSLLFLIDFSIKLSNISHDFSLSSMLSPNLFSLSSYSLHVVLLDLIVSHWSPCSSNVVLPDDPDFLPCFSLSPMLSPRFSSLIPTILLDDPGFRPDFSCYLMFSSYDPDDDRDDFLFLMFPPCWSWWWSWLNLSDDVLPCYHLLADDVFCLFYLFDLIIVVDYWLFLS